MLLIPCPWCGERDEDEFSYGGDASVRRPELEEDDDIWFEYVYLRANPRGQHEEWWQHVAGCRRWLRLRRDTSTHEIAGVATDAGETAP
ncbi:MAG: sarcosine oxidase subunit delta [Burkholderiaceae bacterium]